MLFYTEEGKNKKKIKNTQRLGRFFWEVSLRQGKKDYLISRTRQQRKQTSYGQIEEEGRRPYL